MSTFGLFAFIVLPVLGGLIAWAGDVIGYRLGKSRRSLFGLRPRSTARLVGVAVGVALPLAGLLTAIAGSQEAKDALLHMDLLRQQQEQLTAENQTLTVRNARLQQQIVRARGVAHAGQQHIVALRSDLSGARGELLSTQSRLSGTQSRLGRAQRDVTELKTARQTLRQASYLLQRRVAVLKDQSHRLGGNVRQIKRQLTVTQGDLDKADNLLTTTNAELTARQAELARLRAAVSAAVFTPGHELLRVILEVGDTADETRSKLSAVLVTASEIAAAKGAEVGPNMLAVRLVRGLPPSATTSDEREILTDTAAEMQKAGKRKWVVMVRAAGPMYEKERVQAQVELYPLPYVIAFAKDQVVYSIVVDGSKPRGDIFTELLNLVKQLVRREAQEYGMLRDPETQEYGRHPATEILRALDTISAAGEPMLVQVRATKDTYIADPLAIKLEVSPYEAPNAHANSPRN